MSKTGSLERNDDIEAIRLLKPRYFRGIDFQDPALVRSVLAEDCVLDYTDCFRDPVTGVDFFPELSVVLRGRASWPDKGGVHAMGVVSVHQGYHHEITLTGPASAEGTWSMTDRMFMPEGRKYQRIEGFGQYFDSYEKTDGSWYIKACRLRRLRVVGS